MGPDFIKDVINAFSKVKGEIDKEGGEFDFRYSLLRHLFEGVLEWGRRGGEGHFAIERKRKDVMLYDDSNCCVGVIETKDPGIDLKKEHKAQLKEYLDGIGTAKYGVLTNGRRFILYEYRGEKGLFEIADIDVESLVEKEISRVSKEEKRKILELKRLEKDRFVGIEDPKYFVARVPASYFPHKLFEKA